jgi:ABC-type uncharacterized transport system ATPase subunit
MEFDKPIGNDLKIIHRGTGKFWQINELNPENTIISTCELSRIDDKSVINSMVRSSKKEIKKRIKQTIKDW